MALTRINVEKIMVRRASAIMTAAGLAVTIVGTNADLDDPMSVGIISVGGTVTDRTTVADVDVATVTEADYDEFLDVTEYRLLQTIIDNLANVDIEVGPRNEKLSQLATRLEKTLERKKKDLQSQYGFSTSTIEAGVITLDFAEHDDENVDELGN